MTINENGYFRFDEKTEGKLKELGFRYIKQHFYTNEDVSLSIFLKEEGPLYPRGYRFQSIWYFADAEEFNKNVTKVRKVIKKAIEIIEGEKE